MLTRAQVAKRLGKSIATVRRLEGDRIHPRRDEAGINRFHPAEVDRLAADLRLARRRGTRDVEPAPIRSRPGHRSTWAKTAAFSAASPNARSVDVDESEHEDSPSQVTQVSSLAARIGELERRSSAHERARTRQEWDVECAAIAEEVFAMVASCSARELRRMDPNVMDEIVACLDTLVGNR
jgi:hypothetical protein